MLVRRPDECESKQLMAEKEGFEPSMQVLPACSLSRGVPSTTRPLLRKVRDDTRFAYLGSNSGGSLIESESAV